MPAWDVTVAGTQGIAMRWNEGMLGSGAGRLAKTELTGE